MSPGPLTWPAFRWLVAARTTSLLGNSVAPVALAFAVLDLTGRAVDVGLVVAARSLANVLLLLFGGVLADRLPRQLLLVGSSLAAAATQAAVAGLVLSGEATVPTLAVLSAVNGAVAAVAFPAAAALTPQTVPPALLQPANALLRLGTNTSAIGGATAGGLLIAAAGPGYGLAVDAATYALAAGLFSRIRLTGRVAPAASSSVLVDLRDGWAEFTARRWTWVVVAQFTVVNAAFLGTTAVLGPVVADQSVGRAAYGLVLAAQTAGLLLGGLVALRWQPDRPLRAGVALTPSPSCPPCPPSRSRCLHTCRRCWRRRCSLGSPSSSSRSRGTSRCSSTCHRTDWPASTPTTPSGRSSPSPWARQPSAHSPRSSACAPPCWAVRPRSPSPPSPHSAAAASATYNGSPRPATGDHRRARGVVRGALRGGG